MKRWLGFPLVQIVLCLLAYALLAYHFGKFLALWTSPLLGAAIARPLMALASSIRRKAREHIWLPVHGQHYVFRGTTIHVLEDDDHCRWIRLADVRKVVGSTASERALAAVYPGRLKIMGTPAQAHLRDDALIAHLGKENQPTALRFRIWVERNVALPGRRVRRSLGIVVDAAEPDDLP